MVEEGAKKEEKVSEDVNVKTESSESPEVVEQTSAPLKLEESDIKPELKRKESSEKTIRDLSDEELNLIAMGMGITEDDVENAAIEMEAEREQERVGQFQAAAMGLIEGATFGWAGEGYSFLRSMNDIISTDNTWSDYSALYDKHKRDYEVSRLAANKGWSKTYSAAEIAGGAAIPLGGGISTAKAAGLGALQSVGTADKKGDDLLIEAAKGAAFGGLSQKVLSKVFPKIFEQDKVVRKEIEQLGDDAVDLQLKSMGIVATGEVPTFKGPAKALGKSLDARGKDVRDWGRSTMHVFHKGEPELLLQKGDDYKSLYDKANKEVHFWSQKLNEATAVADEKIGQEIINANSMRDSIDKIVDNIGGSKIPNTKLAIMNMLDNEIGSGSKISISQVNRINQKMKNIFDDFTINSEILNSSYDASGQVAQLKTVLNDYMNKEVADSVRMYGDDVLSEGAVKAYNKLKDFEDLRDLLKEPSIASAVDTVEEKIAGRMVTHLASAGMWGAAGSSFGMVNSVKGALQTVLGSGEKFIQYSPKKMASLDRMIRKFSEEPGKWNRALNQIGLSAFRDPDTLRETLGAIDARIALEEEPLDRNSMDMTLKSPQVYNLLAQYDKTLAAEFMSVVESGNSEAMGKFYELIEQHPIGSQLVRPGIGFNGRVRNEREYALVLDAINKDKVDSETNKMIKKEALMLEGLIPTDSPERAKKKSLTSRVDRDSNGKRTDKI